MLTLAVILGAFYLVSGAPLVAEKEEATFHPISILCAVRGPLDSDEHMEPCTTTRPGTVPMCITAVWPTGEVAKGCRRNALRFAEEGQWAPVVPRFCYTSEARNIKQLSSDSPVACSCAVDSCNAEPAVIY